jgi:glycolate oxidase FAD binding subunit
LIEWQVNQLQREVSDFGSPILRHDGAGETMWTNLVDFPPSERTSVTFKANLLPSATATFCENLIAQKNPPVFHAHAGNGVVIGHLNPEVTLQDAASLIRQAVDAAVACQGNLVLLRCPPAWKKNLPVWGNPRPDNWLMRVVKDKLDPKGLFNPGRFVAGI